MDNWIIEVRKTYYPDKGTLLMELFSISFKGVIENMGSMELGKFSGDEMSYLFNDNFECIFNHFLDKDKIYFFSAKN